MKEVCCRNSVYDYGHVLNFIAVDFEQRINFEIYSVLGFVVKVHHSNWIYDSSKKYI